jgi:hypothetical protein
VIEYMTGLRQFSAPDNAVGRFEAVVIEQRSGPLGRAAYLVEPSLAGAHQLGFGQPLEGHMCPLDPTFVPARPNIRDRSTGHS